MRARRTWTNSIHPHRVSDALDCLWTKLVKGDIKLAPHLIIGTAGHQDTSRLRHAFQTRGDIDAVAIEIAAFDYDVAQINPNAKDDTLVLSILAVRRRHLLLEIDSALD